MTTSTRNPSVLLRRTRRLLPGLGAVLLLSSAAACSHAASAGASSPVTAADVPARAALLINVTHGKSDLHAACMALGLAKTALERGHKVVVFLNVEAAGLAAADLSADVRYADFPPVQQQLRAIMDAGGKVYVCGHCAGIMGVSKDNVLAGITMTDHGSVLDALSPGMVGVSY
jgi:predicted peroxiredoxin